MKSFFASLLFVMVIFSKVQGQQPARDSLDFAGAIAAFEQFEQEHGHYIVTDNVKMHYLTWGTPGAPAIVWVHGTYSNAYEFHGFADSLVKKGYFVIAIDYYGHGFTPIPAKDVSLYHVADDINFLLNHLKIEKAIVGGFSRGGSIATAFYDAYPARVSALILEDGGSVAWSTIENRVSVDSLSEKVKAEFKSFESLAAREFNSRFNAVQQYAGFNDRKRTFLSLASIKEISPGRWVSNPGLAEFLGENSVDRFLEILFRPFASPKLFGASTQLLYPLVIFRNLDVPLLVLDPVSEHDRFKFEDENRKLQQAHPHLVTHKIYSDTPHGLKFKRPKEFLKDVYSFLSTINSKAR